MRHIDILHRILMGLCVECGKAGTNTHHIIPQSKGGKAWIRLCHVCHARAHSVKEGVAYQPGLIRAGLERAKERGVILGAPKKVNDGMIDAANDMRNEGKTLREIANKLGVSVGTAHNLTKQPRVKDVNTLS